MKIYKHIFILGAWCFGLPANSQLKFDTIYQTGFLREQFAKAAAEKDSISLGMAAFLLGGNLEWEGGETSETVDLLTLSLDCFAAVGDSGSYYLARPRLTDYYIDSKRYGEAEKILLEGRAYYDRKEDWAMKIHMVSRLGRLYQEMGDTVRAAQFKEECHRLNLVVKDTLLDIIYMLDRAGHYHEQGRLDTALALARRSLVLSNAIGRSKFIALGLYNIGILNQYKNNLDTAIFYLKKAEKTDRPIGFSQVRQGCFKHLSECYARKKDYQNAHKYLLRYAVLSDSILNKSRTEALDKMTLAFETKEKEAAIDFLEKEKLVSREQSRMKSLMLMGLSFVLLGLFVAVWFLVRFYKEKIRKDKIISAQAKNLNQQKIRSLQNEVQLTTAKAMLEGQEKERTRIASDLHDSLGGLLSTIKLQWKNSREPTNRQIGALLDKAANEVRSIAQNLRPSSLQHLGLVPAITDLINSNSRPGHLPKISFQHHRVPGNLDPDTALQLYRIVQEAFSNALKHAGASEILVQINGVPNGISLLVEDDGKGFDVRQNRNGSGLENMDMRARFLQAELTVESSTDGTTVFVLCPIGG